MESSFDAMMYAASALRCRTDQLRRNLFLAMLLPVGCLSLLESQAASSLTPLVSFNGTNGANPAAGLATGLDGSFYGTTTAGGSNGVGTIFRVSSIGGFTNLAAFDGTNGSAPAAALLRGSDGFLYGTTPSGGTNSNHGTAFRADTNGVIYPLVSFAGTNGAQPYAPLSQDASGQLYGTCLVGGAFGAGVAFELATNGSLAPLASFDYHNLGPYGPYGGLTPGGDGFFYGTTFQGGSNGFGAVFRLATNGAISNWYSFTDGADGSNPEAGLTRGADGAFYGTTYYGGSNSLGTLFKVTTNGAFTPLVSFDGTNGAYPAAALMLSSNGNLYGTTAGGGVYGETPGAGYGTIFKLATNGTFISLASFDYTNGAYPQAGLVQDAAGNLYGTATSGGDSGAGTVFKLVVSPPAQPVLQSLTPGNGWLTMSWSAEAGQVYQLQFKTDLGQASWMDLGGQVTATNSSVILQDIIGPDPMRFYRLEALQ